MDEMDNNLIFKFNTGVGKINFGFSKIDIVHVFGIPDIEEIKKSDSSSYVESGLNP